MYLFFLPIAKPESRGGTRHPITDGCSDEPAARTALRNALALLRTLLPDPDASPAPHSHLRSERDLLGLDPQAPLELDLEVVQQAYREDQRLSTLPAEPQRAALVAQGQQALALVRGPFLDGFWLGEGSPFDEWVLQAQQQWQVRVQLLCERLSAFQEGGFELEQARATLTRWLASPALRHYGMLRMVHDVFHISGFLLTDALGQVVQIVLNQAAPLAPALVNPVGALLARTRVAVNLGQT